ncbi:MAG: SIS domain-containing protein [Thermomicrobiales bacterium]|nr:SIS domain-containing protein [Thermomicrobiales bacterium]
MATDFDRAAHLAGFEAANAAKYQAADLGAKLATRNPKRLYFVGQGAPNKAMAVVKYWAERVSTALDLRIYYPAEFVNQNPAALDENTIVILGSHSGTTPETVRAAEFLRDTPVTTIGITQKADSPLAKAVTHPVLYGETLEGYTCGYILVQALVSALLQGTDGWTLHDKIMSSLDALPAVTADATEASDARSVEEARLFKDDRVIYTVGAGPCFTTAYVLGVCVLMEMQWLHAQPLVAAEFFHGPFEVVDQTTPLIIFLGEDPSRPEAERVVRFCQKYTERTMIYDSKDFAMDGVDPEVRAIVAPFVLQAAVDRFTARLAVWHNHPLSTRRYMWKTEY